MRVFWSSGVRAFAKFGVVAIMNSKSLIWAQLFLSPEDSLRVRNFFVREIGIDPFFIVRRMHITVYHALGPIPGVVPLSESARIALPVSDTRFMVMVPGGETARPGIDPATRKIGIRVQKRSATMAALLEFRNRLIQHESEDVLGGLRSSTRSRSAFGAPNFQPHVTVLKPGSGIGCDLTPIGARFRETLGILTFDRFAVEIVEGDPRLENWRDTLRSKWGPGK
jgi:hypothetical protein